MKNNRFNKINATNSSNNVLQIDPVIDVIDEVYNNKNLLPQKDFIDIFFEMGVGESINSSDLNFTNFDNEFPSHTTVKNSFELIKKDLKNAIIEHIKWLQFYPNISDRLLPIIKLRYPNFEVNTTEGTTDIVESRIYSTTVENKGSFRLFSKYYPTNSLIQFGMKAKNPTLVVILYDPYHLVFPDEKVGRSYDSYRLYSCALKKNYYSYIPSNLRIKL